MAIGELVEAVLAGNIQLVVELLESGIDVNEVDHKGRTALMVAVMRRNRTMMQCLWDHGADSNVITPSGYTPMHAAISRCDLSIAQELLDHGAVLEHPPSKIPPLMHMAAMHDCPSMIRWLHRQGVSVDKENSKGYTPLMIAAIAGKESSVVTLLDLDADISIKSRDGLAALRYAGGKDRRTIANMLKLEHIKRGFPIRELLDW